MAASKRFPAEVTTRMTYDLKAELERAAAAEGFQYVSDFVRALLTERLRAERLEEDERIRRRALALAQDALRRMQETHFNELAERLKLEEVAA